MTGTKASTQDSTDLSTRAKQSMDDSPSLEQPAVCCCLFCMLCLLFAVCCHESWQRYLTAIQGQQELPQGLLQWPASLHGQLLGSILASRRHACADGQQENEQAGRQAGRQAIQQSYRQPSKPAGKQACRQVSKETKG